MLGFTSDVLDGIDAVAEAWPRASASMIAQARWAFGREQ
jgi:hypothetical protein